MKSKYTLIISIALFLLLSVSFGAAKAKGPLSGVAVQNASLSPVGQIGGLAYTLFVDGGYAYVGSGSSFSIYSLADPTLPKRTGYVMLPEKVLGVQAAGNYAYLVTESRFYVFSIADKSHPLETGSCAVSGTGAKTLCGRGVRLPCNMGGRLANRLCSRPRQPDGGR